jgi:hypothetical protein
MAIKSNYKSEERERGNLFIYDYDDDDETEINNYRGFTVRTN